MLPNDFDRPQTCKKKWKHIFLKVKVPTVVVHVFSVSQYMKYTQSNIRIHFINNKLANTYLFAIFLYDN